MKREGARPRAPVATFHTRRPNLFPRHRTRAASLPKDRGDAIPPEKVGSPIAFHEDFALHRDHDLSDLFVRLHVTVRFDDFFELKSFGDDRFEHTGS